VGEGGLIGYGGSTRSDLIRPFREAYVEPRLRAARRSRLRLRVQQPHKFELAINLKAAKALGLAVRNHCASRGPGDRVTPRMRWKRV